MSLKEKVVEELKTFSEEELREIADYITFLKFRSRVKFIPPMNEEDIAQLYAEVGNEDRALAEEGLPDYHAGLKREDTH